MWYDLNREDINITLIELDQKLTYLKIKSNPNLFLELLNNKNMIVNMIHKSLYDHLQIIIKYNDKIYEDTDICSAVISEYRTISEYKRLSSYHMMDHTVKHTNIIIGFINKKVNADYLLVPMLLINYNKSIIECLFENGYINNLLSSINDKMDIDTICKIITFFWDNNIKMCPNRIYSNYYNKGVNIIYFLISKIRKEEDFLMIERIADKYVINPTMLITYKNITISDLLSNIIKTLPNNGLSNRLSRLKNAILQKYDIKKSTYELLPQPIAEEIEDEIILNII